VGNSVKVDYSARHESFERWFQSSLGRAMLASQRRVLDQAVAPLTGARQLQVGLSHRLPLATGSDFAQKIITSPAWQPHMPDGAAVCHSDELPFPSDSMDLVILHHTADFSPDPHAVLRESARVLRGEGKIALIGFNPLSLWGMRRAISRHHEGPWGGRFMLRSRMEDWLRLLSFQVDDSATHFLTLPLQNASRHRRALKRQRDWLPIGAYYCILARKREYARLKPRLNWRKAKVIPVPAGSIGATGSCASRGRSIKQTSDNLEKKWPAR
jgi:SAM-dependent methyltransferase